MKHLLNSLKTLKDLVRFTKALNLGKCLKNLMLCVFHPKHPFKVCFGAEHLGLTNIADISLLGFINWPRILWTGLFYTYT